MSEEQQWLKEGEWGAWRTSAEAVDMVVKLMVTVNEHGAAIQRDADSRQFFVAGGGRFRNLGSLLAASDAIWLSKEPPDHPEFIEGTTYIVIIRNGKIIAKEHLSK